MGGSIVNHNFGMHDANAVLENVPKQPCAFILSHYRYSSHPRAND